jgi:glycine cleavage system H protein
MLKFSKSHEWAKIDGSTAMMGITDYAQHSLGDIVFVELPKAGTKVTQSGRLGTIESTKAASELYSPISGEVIEVNKELAGKPQLVNEDPLGRGWMIKIKIANQKESEGLMDEAQYREFVEKEKH